MMPWSASGAGLVKILVKFGRLFPRYRDISRHRALDAGRCEVARRMSQEETVLSDASWLIGLAAAGAFDVLPRLFKTIFVTESMRREVTVRDAAGISGAHARDC
jgi:hypothetical protein